MSSQTKHGVKGRVYLTPEEAPAAARQFGCARFVYNHLLEFSRSRYFTNKTKTSPAERSIELTRLKSETPWLQEVNAQALQQTERALDTAYKNWFDSITGKRPDKINPPKFKKKSKRQSARFTRGAFRFDKNSGTLSLSKIGDIPIPWYRRVKGEPSSVVLSRTPSGRCTCLRNRKHRWRRAAMSHSNCKESPDFRRGESSIAVERLQLGIYQERIVELRHFAPAFAKNREQSCRKWFVPLECQAGHVADDEGKLLGADVPGERNGVQARATHRRITEQGVNGKVSFAPPLGQSPT